MYSANAFSTKFLATSVNSISSARIAILLIGYILGGFCHQEYSGLSGFLHVFVGPCLLCVVGWYSRFFLLLFLYTDSGYLWLLYTCFFILFLIGKRFHHTLRYSPTLKKRRINSEGSWSATVRKRHEHGWQSLATKSSFPAAALGLLRYRPKWALQLQMETSCHQNSQKKTEWSWAYLAVKSRWTDRDEDATGRSGFCPTPCYENRRPVSHWQPATHQQGMKSPNPIDLLLLPLVDSYRRPIQQIR